MQRILPLLRRPGPGAAAQAGNDAAASSRPAAPARRLASSETGFSLVETIVAAGLLAGAVAVLGQMFAISMADNTSARTVTFVTVLAEQKMEQLRGLTWGFDLIGLPLTDTSSNIARPIQSGTGGPGLTPSPSNSLRSNVEGYVDYVDQFGRIIGGETTVPAGAVYVRRWSVEPLPTNPANTVILQVVVTKSRNRGTADSDDGSTRRLRDQARLMTVRTRKSQ
jgi:type II secretory pathway pseudopilin PulG